VASSVSAAPIKLSASIPVNEELRAQYARCDAENRFRNLALPIRNAQGDIVWYGCSTDPNRLELLSKFPATATSRAAIAFTSKLGLDLDGSWIA